MCRHTRMDHTHRRPWSRGPTFHHKLEAGLVVVTTFHQLPPAQQPPEHRPGPGELTAVQRADSPILAPLQPPASASIP